MCPKLTVSVTHPVSSLDEQVLCATEYSRCSTCLSASSLVTKHHDLTHATDLLTAEARIPDTETL